MLNVCRPFLATGALIVAMGAAAPMAMAAGGRCNGADIATGPFSYTPSSLGQATFQGTTGNPVSANFAVLAPSVNENKRTDAIDVFPGEGQDQDGTCPQLADATFRVFEIVKDLDADGNDLLEPVVITGALYDQIAGAFSFVPPDSTFAPGLSVDVTVTVANPQVAAADYGRYKIKVAAHAPGAGIGVGPGSEFVLVLKAVELVDKTPPTVNISAPSGDEILGRIDVAFSAVDPAPGSGVNSVSATIKSAAAVDENDGNPGVVVPLALSVNPTLPAAAGVAVSATGVFNPTGAQGAAGTTLTQAFTAANRSGIGNYVLEAKATDVAGNEGSLAQSFAVRYQVDPAISTSGNCAQLTNPGCAAQVRFTAKRSLATSDGAFMFDTTVVTKVVRKSDGVVMDTHTYSASGDPKDAVKFDLTGPQYMTTHRRTEFDVAAAATNVDYTVKIYFRDVDGNLSLQGTADVKL